MNPATKTMVEAALQRWPELKEHKEKIVSDMDEALAETASAFSAGPSGGCIWVVHGSNDDLVAQYKEQQAELIWKNVPAPNEHVPAGKWLISRQDC